ncbi:MAG TPA: PTS transporter subunit EIIC [Candidatus Faecalibacterium intestinigallinarum]|uniref:PTS transporter subunit EIIC n=1 Tax=Candidatus Faecalibacterium intestinigallinarum TaxID=2838581 RepID=A0A9D1QA11_9FIRM|nr:PTS transporter subunit EIIC [Candidatus Faecalibacterium intestinigallinarum]
MMKFLQKLGKSLMLPVAVLPICGLLMGIGYALCPSTMQGGSVEGLAQIIGFLLVKAGGALIDNMQILFVIGVAVGMADEPDGTPALAGLASWLMIQQLLSTGVVSTIMPNVVDGTTEFLAFSKISNPFIGILCGLIGAFSYNRFKNMQLPDFLAFFSGKRFVAMAAAVISIVASVVLLFVWPLVFGGLVALGKGIEGMGAFGAGLYAFFNRLLIPIGMHHALNNVFWFDTIGLGDLTNFWAGKTSADVSWSLGMYMSGFFPCMMFGVPAAAAAMIATAKNKKAAAGLLVSTAICAFVCGVTEPFEFSFMFVAFPLYVVYAALYGIFTVITYYTGFRAGFSFSAGATDLVFSASLPAAEKTWMIIPLGIGAAIVFFVVFYALIKAFNFKTPGREDDDENTDAEKKVVLANNNYTQVAAGVLAAVGGKGNVKNVEYCATRLRFEIKDYTAVDEKAVKAAGAAGVIRPSKNACQVIIGTKVQFVYDELKKML